MEVELQTKVTELNAILIFWKPTKGQNSKSYGPLATIPVYTIHAVIVIIVMFKRTFSFLAFIVPEKSVTKTFKDCKKLRTIQGT